MTKSKVGPVVDVGALDKDCAEFVVNERIVMSKAEFLKEISDVGAAFDYFIKKSQQRCMKLFFYELPTPLNATSGKQRFLYRLLLEYQEKYQTFYTDYFQMCATKASQICFFMSDFKDSGNFFKYRTFDFRNKMNSLFINSSEKKKIVAEMGALDKLANEIKSDLKVPMVSRGQMQDAMQNFEMLIESKSDYCPISGFDDLFYRYIFYSKRSRLFDEALKNSEEVLKQTMFHKDYVVKEKEDPWNSPKISFLSIAKIYNALGEVMQPDTAKQATILRCAVIRYFFDQLYIACPFYSAKINPLIYQNFENNCSIVKELTCKELHINETLLKEGQDVMKFKDVAIDYAEAIGFISQMQFYTDPTAIAWLSSKAMSVIERVTKSNIRTQKDDEEDISESTSFMAFDDVFSIYWPLLSLHPLPDPIVISLFVKTVVGIKLTSPMEYAKTVFISAVEYIRDFHMYKNEQSVY